MDVTTATRFHLGEIALSTVARLGIIPLAGIPLRVIVGYELILLLSTQFHHSNIALPAGIDRILRTVIVSPNMHRVHHSIERVETDSNYSSVLSIWDRLFRSYREKPDYRQIRFGVEGFSIDGSQSVKGLLLTPTTSGRVGRRLTSSRAPRDVRGASIAALPSEREPSSSRDRPSS
jgi:sterol desaturase/sphingolipid hydroxylase (fatty acid hydroxylase superfamily)